MWAAEPQRAVTGANGPFEKAIAHLMLRAAEDDSSGGTPESRAIEAAEKTVACWYERGLLRTATEVYYTDDQCAVERERAELAETRLAEARKQIAASEVAP